jgi:peptidoglycan/xylan/chitin deacetylase (PgdA/CDA1 family)
MLSAIGTLSLGLARCFKAGGVIINEHTLDRDETRRHVDTLGRWFDFIHLNELPARLNRRRNGKPFCLLTFDDGKRSNRTIVAPELERLGVPAVFFVVTSYLSGQTPLWFDRYWALRAKLGAEPFGLPMQLIKQIPYDLLVDRLERACAQSGVEGDLNNDDVRPMTWDEARNLHGRGFSIGAHGDTHAIMTRVARPAALQNIAKSIARVGEEMGAPCTSFAFPNGNYTPELAQHAIRCGAKIVMTTEPMWVDKTFPLWRLPRVQLFRTDSRGKIELKIATAAPGWLRARLASRQSRWHGQALSKDAPAFTPISRYNKFGHAVLFPDPAEHHGCQR